MLKEKIIQVDDGKCSIYFKKVIQTFASLSSYLKTT